MLIYYTFLSFCSLSPRSYVADLDYSVIVLPTDETGATYYPKITRPLGTVEGATYYPKITRPLGTVEMHKFRFTFSYLFSVRIFFMCTFYLV